MVYLRLASPSPLWSEDMLSAVHAGTCESPCCGLIYESKSTRESVIAATPRSAPEVSLGRCGDSSQSAKAQNFLEGIPRNRRVTDWGRFGVFSVSAVT
jgi:hypothetical protein